MFSIVWEGSLYKMHIDVKINEHSRFVIISECPLLAGQCLP